MPQWFAILLRNPYCVRGNPDGTMRWFALLLIFGVCAPLAAQDPIPDTTEVWRYFPLEIGNVWEYRQFDRALKEAKRFCKVNVIADKDNDALLPVPEAETWSLDPDAAYVYYTDNETISGVQFPAIPDVADVPLVTDMTSSLLSKPLDISRYGVIFAGAQKNQIHRLPDTGYQIEHDSFFPSPPVHPAL